MNDRYYIVNGAVLPEVFEKVIEVKSLLSTKKVKDITEGVKKVGISRSVYYKYKDNVFLLSEMSKGRKATMNVQVDHKAGVLSTVTDIMAKYGANILTINQGVPINNAAFINLTIDISSMTLDLKELVSILNSRDCIVKAEILAIE